MTFWDWAVSAYAGDGVADLCLTLQDENDQNVPLLLWAVWLATETETVEPTVEAAVSLTRQWSEAAIVPLRQVRRRLKTGVSEGDDAWRLPLREKIKAAELEAERALMAQLAVLASEQIVPKSEKNHHINDLVLQNLRTVASAWHENVPEDRLIRLSQALSDGHFLRYDVRT